jgi:hypothetical protein
MERSAWEQNSVSSRFCLYASLPHPSLLQGTASIGANWPQY